MVLVADINNNSNYQSLLAIIGKNVAKYRKRKGLTQPQLANKLELSTTFIANIERAVSAPSLLTILDISTALNISPCFLFQDKDILFVPKDKAYDAIISIGEFLNV